LLFRSLLQKEWPEGRELSGFQFAASSQSAGIRFAWQGGMNHGIVVPLDGSPFAEQALPLALAIAGRAGAPLDLVQVHLLYALRDPASAWLPYDSTLETKLQDQERTYLEGVAARLRQETAVPVRATLALGSVVDAILGHMQNQPADLLVMTTHGRGPWGRFWLGSVADELVRRCPVPLLLVRPQEAASGPAPEPGLGHFLVPLDGSTLAEQGWTVALPLAKLMGARFTLLTAVEPVWLPGYDPTGSDMAGFDKPLLERSQAAAQDYLDRVAERVRAEGFKVQTHVAVGRKAAPAILEQARADGADVIALATHGRSGMRRAMLGSVADKVVRGAPVPVLLCRLPEGRVDAVQRMSEAAPSAEGPAAASKRP
jgi:nucleotide-binding universal stress UspA family protein